MLIILQILVSLYLHSLPLTRYLDYEYSVVQAIVIFILHGIHIITVPLRDESLRIARLKVIYAPAFIMVILGLLIGILVNGINGSCPFTYGLAFYLLITFPIPFIASGYFLYLQTFRRMWIRVACFVGSVLFILLLPAFELFRNPQIYFFHPVIAYFPGTIYDELIEITPELILYRTIVFTFFTTISIWVLYFYKNFSVKTQRLVFLSALFLSLTFYLLSPIFGFATNNSRVVSVLQSEFTTTHCIIHYDSTSISRDEIIYAAGLHETYYRQLARYFAFELNTVIHSYLFNSAEQKYALLGAGRADVAKPWLGDIYITKESYESTLKHELAHIFSATFGATPFKLAGNFNPALIEGLAVSAEEEYAGYPLDFIAHQLFNFDSSITVEKIFNGAGFFGTVPSAGYALAGAFLSFLHNTYGSEKLKAVYGLNNFQQIYGKNIRQLETDFRNYLKNCEFKYEKDLAILLFGRTPLFRKICPRESVRITHEIDKALKENNYSDAEKLISRLEKITSGPEVVFRKAILYERNKNFTSLVKLFEKFLADYSESSFKFIAEIRLADALILSGNDSSALEYYKRFINSEYLTTYQIIASQRLFLYKQNRLKTYLDMNTEERKDFLLDIGMSDEPDISLAYYLLTETESVDEKIFVSLLQKEQLKPTMFNYFSVVKIYRYYLRKRDIASAKMILRAFPSEFNNPFISYLKDEAALIEGLAELYYYYK